MAPRRPIVAQDIFQIHALSSLSESPDGRLLAFADRVPDEGSDGYRSTIRVVDLGTGEVRAWTSPGHSAHSPAWSPDGRELAYLCADGGPAQLCILPGDGGEPRQLTQLPLGVEGFRWSPDSSRLCLVAAAGEKGDPLAPRVIETLRYKFNGRGFTFNRRRHLFVVDRLGGAPRQLTDGPFEDGDPAWSPDGGTIAFASARHEEHEFDLAADIYLVSAEGGEPQKVTGTTGAAASPVFSPDGRWIAYAGTERSQSMPSHRHIFAVSAAGGPSRRVDALDRTLQGDTRLSFAPDGQAVFGVFEDEGRTVLLRVGFPTGEASGDRETAQQIQDYALLADGRIAYIATTATRPPELYVAAFTGERLEPERRTFLHDAWLEEVQPQDMAPYRAESTDGTSVPCWIMQPDGAGAPHSVPGLLKIHGGPYAQFGYAFNHELQWYVGQGYAVFFCNPRGSSGYAEQWARSLGRERGILDFQDVMACTDAALANFPRIDPSRLAVNGGSYGGYLTSWIVGHTDRFRAACSEAAPNNLYSMSGSSDLAGSNHRLVYGFTAQEDPEFYLSRSPISYAKDILTPLLIIHSEDDLRVSIEQGEQLFVALRLLRRPVRFVRFPGENHGLPRGGRPTHRLQRLAFIRAWFEENLARPKAGGAEPIAMS